MKIAIIVSTKDLAGMNIKEHLIRNHNFKQTEQQFNNSAVFLNENIDTKLYTITKETTEYDNIDEEIDADIFIYATRHRSKSEIPSLSVHCTGNWNIAELGGKDKELCISPANFLKDAMIYMQNNFQKHDVLKDFDIIQECTHHGPLMQKPLLFIEIGSTEKEWQIPEAGEFIAETIIHLIKNSEIIHKKDYKTAFGIGGPHTTPNFKKIILGNKIAISHVCPKYMLDHLDSNMIEKGIKRSVKKAELIILDWKGLGPNKKRINELLKDFDIDIKKTKDF